jgi:hypothetical protein
MMWLLKLSFNQNLITINYKFNCDFKSYIIWDEKEKGKKSTSHFRETARKKDSLLMSMDVAPFLKASFFWPNSPEELTDI